MAMSRLKPSGRIGDNMKKILGLVALFVIIISSCFYFFIRQPKNIFDEIYQETEKTYRTNNISKEDLDKDYDEIVNQKVLKDWCSIYDSKFSPSNYGDVKIETQWENWW